MASATPSGHTDHECEIGFGLRVFAVPTHRTNDRQTYISALYYFI